MYRPVPVTFSLPSCRTNPAGPSRPSPQEPLLRPPPHPRGCSLGRNRRSPRLRSGRNRTSISGSKGPRLAVRRPRKAPQSYEGRRRRGRGRHERAGHRRRDRGGVRLGRERARRPSVRCRTSPRRARRRRRRRRRRADLRVPVRDTRLQVVEERRAGAGRDRRPRAPRCSEPGSGPDEGRLVPPARTRPACASANGSGRTTQCDVGAWSARTCSPRPSANTGPPVHERADVGADRRRRLQQDLRGESASRTARRARGSSRPRRRSCRPAPPRPGSACRRRSGRAAPRPRRRSAHACAARPTRDSPPAPSSSSARSPVTSITRRRAPRRSRRRGARSAGSRSGCRGTRPREGRAPGGTR